MEPDWKTEDGSIMLWNADCREVLPTLAFQGVDCLITDPPYNVGFDYANDADERTAADWEAFCRQWFAEARRVAKCVLLNPGTKNAGLFATIEHPKWWLCWHKPAAMGRSPVRFCNWEPVLLYGKPSGDTTCDVFRAPIVPDDSLEGHPCPKPLAWGVELVRMGAAEGGLVCDPFLGSGTVAVAAVRTGRRCYGIEREPKYFEIAVKRITDELNRAPLFETPPVIQRSFLDTENVA